ncbi:PLP-dependent transferase [Aaosphaeria arxii CBS 175.79]|uniref:PLP-dependent transferase n=1 Tax=Aaosphaeria arxii CBS 175.79 TaxID=1450172 RepID=A0A6A5Y678_9PLEO|nr:PLP-dependent transferase [Aaosphaeria arxii CBS 175.79]KAF2020809.1 PLP-dependent transferase [Aaosphaeria arxii CBS 175.79]
MSSSQTSSLGQRGVALASGPNLRDKATDILARQWDPVTNPDGAVNIGTAENHLMIEEVAESIRSKNALNSEVLDYGEGPWGTQRLRNAMARFMNRHFHPHVPIDPEYLTFANGCNPIFNMLGLVLGDPGDGILLTRPSYIAFASGLGLVANMKPIYVPFHPLSFQFSPTSTSAYSNTLQTASSTHGIRTRALILCNPHNPLGRCYPITTLIAILKFCSFHGLHLISDEIYAMSVYPTSTSPDATPFTSILAVPDLASYIDPDYVHVLYGLSKDFCAGGMRLGCLYTTNGALRRAVSAVSEFHWPGGIDQVVAATVLEDEEWVDGFLERSRRRLGVASGFAKGLLREVGIEWEEGDGGVNAGFFLWVDLRRWVVRDGEDGDDGWEGERRLVERMKAEKVFLTAGRAQGSSEPGWFRFVFSREERVVREGIKRLVKCLEGIKADMDKEKGG